MEVFVLERPLGALFLGDFVLDRGHLFFKLFLAISLFWILPSKRKQHGGQINMKHLSIVRERILIVQVLLLFFIPTFVQALETATFAAGCFWGSEEFFKKIPGVVSTQVGYAGGKTSQPKYSEVSSGTTGHAESVQVQFDPKKVSYEQLLNSFFKMHDPTTKDQQGNDRGSQYRSAIFYQNDSQKKTAEEFMKRVDKSKAWKKPVVTEISKAAQFWPAEDYHQNYLTKNKGGYDNHYLRDISFGITPAAPEDGKPKSSLKQSH